MSFIKKFYLLSWLIGRTFTNIKSSTWKLKILTTVFIIICILFYDVRISLYNSLCVDWVFMFRKHLFKSALLHCVLLDFLRACDKQDREEVLEAIHSEIENLLTSNAGQKVAIMVLWHGTNKVYTFRDVDM